MRLQQQGLLAVVARIVKEDDTQKVGQQLKVYPWHRLLAQCARGSSMHSRVASQVLSISPSPQWGSSATGPHGHHRGMLQTPQDPGPKTLRCHTDQSLWYQDLDCCIMNKDTRARNGTTHMSMIRCLPQNYCGDLGYDHHTTVTFTGFL